MSQTDGELHDGKESAALRSSDYAPITVKKQSRQAKAKKSKDRQYYRRQFSKALQDDPEVAPFHIIVQLHYITGPFLLQSRLLL